MTKRIYLVLSTASFIVLLVPLSFSGIAHGEILGEWQVGPGGGNVSESDGVLTMSGGDGHNIAPYLFREFSPEGDFEISFDLKAETLGEVLLDQAGEGFVFSFGNINMTSQDRVGSFWLRARAGGQFLLAWHDDLCDLYGWGCNWEPFVYNGIGHDNGYDFWHPNPPQDRSTALVKPDVWYTLRLRVRETPFAMTGEVYAENGTLLGSLMVDSMNDFTFKDINRLYMSTGAGGTFYIRKLSEGDPIFKSTVLTQISILPEIPSATLGSPITIGGKLTDLNGSALSNEVVVLWYTFTGLTEWVPISSSFTNDAGEYSVQWVNTASGNFTLRAGWSGNSTHLGASSTTTLSILPYQKQTVFLVESNSTVTALAFDSASSELRFSVTGSSGTTGFVRATVAKSLVANGADLKVYLDGNQLNYEATSNADSWLLSFTYAHSTHEVSIALAKNGGGITSLGIESWTWIIVAIIIVAIGTSLIVYFKKRKH